MSEIVRQAASDLALEFGNFQIIDQTEKILGRSEEHSDEEIFGPSCQAPADIYDTIVFGANVAIIVQFLFL